MADGSVSVATGSAAAAPSPGAGAEGPPLAHLQRLVDEAATFNVFAVPDRRADGGIAGGRDGPLGLQASATLHRFDIALDLPTAAGVRVANQVGEAVGRLDLRWPIIPHDFHARPDREPPPTPLDRSRSQRFAMQECSFAFGDGQDGFRSFGSGRTFPFWVAGRPVLVAAAIGNLTEGFGKFRGHEGNFTLCGEITAEHGFLGHVLVRVQDSQGTLLTTAALPPIEAGPDPDPGTTYLAWSAQKGEGKRQENRFSFAPDGQVRGILIPVNLKRVEAGFAAGGSEGFRCRPLRTGEVIGLEIGFGRGSVPGADPSGTALQPFLFEGVARYSLDDPGGRELGAVTTNVVEGRRFDMRLQGAPDEPALRFGFFGPIVLGTGCFRGLEGMFYGASGSIFKLPPAPQVITHYYVARLHDQEGRLRAARGRS